jgi:uncharacterized membrane protein
MNPDPSVASDKGVFWPVLALSATGAGLRSFRLSTDSIWLDEAYSLKLAAASWREILQGAARDVHPPLYHLLLAGWIRIFGRGEIGLRSLSVLCGVALIPVVYRLAESWAGKQAALWAAALAAASPYLIEISRSGRMGSMLSLFSALSVLTFAGVLQGKGKRFLFGYCVVTLAALYTHYFAFLMLLAQDVFFLIGIARRRWSSRLLDWLLAQLILLVGFCPWFAIFCDHVARGPSWRGSSVHWYELPFTFYHLSLGTACQTRIDRGIALGAYGGALLVLVWFALPRRQVLVRAMPGAVWGLTLMLVLVPLATVWSYSRHTVNVVDPRYLSISALPLLVVGGVLLAGLPKFAQILTGGLLLLAFVVPIRNQWFVQSYYEDWRSMARYLNTHAQAGDTVVVYPAWNELPLATYLVKDLKIQGFPGRYDPIAGGTAHVSPADREAASRLHILFPSTMRRVWLLLVDDQEIQQTMRAWFAGRYVGAQGTRFSTMDVRLWVKPERD